MQGPAAALEPRAACRRPPAAPFLSRPLPPAWRRPPCAVVICEDGWAPSEYDGYEVQLFRATFPRLGWTEDMLVWRCLPFDEAVAEVGCEAQRGGSAGRRTACACRLIAPSHPCPRAPLLPAPPAADLRRQLRRGGVGLAGGAGESGQWHHLHPPHLHQRAALLEGGRGREGEREGEGGRGGGGEGNCMRALRCTALRRERRRQNWPACPAPTLAPPPAPRPRACASWRG